MDMDMQQDEKQNLSKGGGTPCESMAIHICCITVSADILLQLGYVFLGGWWQDLHYGHRKTLHSAKPINARKTENPIRGRTSCAVALCGSPDDEIAAKPPASPLFDDRRNSTG